MALKVNADISILDKSVILGLPFCVFAGYSVLPWTLALDQSLAKEKNECLPDGIKTINWL